MNQSSRKQKVERDWYSVSVESMRRTMVLLFFVVALIVGAFGYQQWEHRSLEGRADQVIREAKDLSRELEERSDYQQVRREFFGAWEDLEAARRAFEDGGYREALTRGRRSLQEFRQILQSGEEDNASRGRFTSVSGSVEYRRGERGAWKRARPQDTLSPGDWVKTSADSSAEILFPDGTEYTLRASTMVHLNTQTDRFGRSEQVAEMSFGWVELNTEQNASLVKTPKSEANVRRSSEAMVAFDRERSTSTVAAYQGSVEVVAENGQSQTIGALQQVMQVGDLLQGPSSLPDRPRLQSPGNDWEIDLAGRELRLSWRPVTGAGSYALHVSRSPLFASNLIEDEGRQKTTARLGLRSEGVFYWQVAAIGGDGVRGPWSEPRSFRISSRRSSRDNDKTPPPIHIEDVQTYGSLVLVSGRTETGASLSINGEEATVNPDGSFNKTLQMSQEGFVFVEVTAEDAAGNASNEQRRVFIDSVY